MDPHSHLDFPLPDLDLEDPPCAFLPTTLDAPPRAATATSSSSYAAYSSSESFSKPITGDAAWDAGKGIFKEDVVSLVFLLIGRTENALQICREVIREEMPVPPKDMGSYFLLCVVRNAAKKKLEKMDVKVICALHLINKYKVIEDLVGLSRQAALDKFRKREYVYLDPLRVGLFKLAYRQSSEERRQFMAKVAKELDCQPRMGTGISEDCLEIGMLEMMYLRKLYPGEPLAKIARHLPADRRLKQFLPISSAPSSMEDEREGLRLKRGFCLIINQEIFYEDKRTAGAKLFDNRDGTQKDVNSLRSTWTRFGCDVEVLSDLTHSGIVDSINAYKDRDYGRYDFFVCCLLGHGDCINNVDYFYGVNGVAVDLKEAVVRPFIDANLCKSLAGKLQLFLIQACRGKQPQPLVTFDGEPTLVMADGNAHPGNRRTAPAIADYVKFHSTIEGFAAFRHIKEGSHFIQMLCREMNAHGHCKPLFELLRRVADNLKGMVSQVPEVNSAYSKDPYFTDTARVNQEVNN